MKFAVFCTWLASVLFASGKVLPELGKWSLVDGMLAIGPLVLLLTCISIAKREDLRKKILQVEHDLLEIQHQLFAEFPEARDDNKPRPNEQEEIPDGGNLGKIADFAIQRTTGIDHATAIAAGTYWIGKELVKAGVAKISDLMKKPKRRRELEAQLNELSTTLSQLRDAYSTIILTDVVATSVAAAILWIAQ